MHAPDILFFPDSKGISVKSIGVFAAKDIGWAPNGRYRDKKCIEEVDRSGMTRNHKER